MYGGTASEMYRLLQRAAELDETFAKTAEFSIDSKGHLEAEFADITQAIHIVQEEMGIAGATALEAGTTIQGSVSSMKSAWQNLITGLADGNADIGNLIDNLVTTIVGDGTEKNLGVIGNILPAIERALGGAVKLIGEAAPKIIEIFPGLVEEILPALLQGATDLIGSVAEAFPDLLEIVSTTIAAEIDNLVQSFLDILLSVGNALSQNSSLIVDAFGKILESVILWIGEYSSVFADVAVRLIRAIVDGISKNSEMLYPTIVTTIEYLVTTFMEMLPKILEIGLEVISKIADGIANNIDGIIPTIVSVILKIVDVLTRSDILQNLLDASFVIIEKLATGIMEAIPELMDAILMIVEKIVTVLLKPENLAKLIATAIDLVVAIASGLIAGRGELISGIGDLIDSVVEEWKNTDWKKIGKDVLTGLWNGISDKVSWLKRKVTGVVDKIKGWFTGSSGFDTHSPSKWSAKVFKNVMDGGVVGLDDGLPSLLGGVDDVVGRVKDGMSIDSFSGEIGYGQSRSVGGTSIGNITINIDGAKYSDEHSLAQAVAEAIQNMTDRRSAVYA